MLHVPLPLSAKLQLRTGHWAVKMVDDRQLARDALLGLEEEAWRDDALAMIYDTDTSQAAKLHHLCWSFAALLHWLEQ